MLVLFFSSSLAQWSCLVKGEGYRIHFSFFAYHYYFNSLNFKSQVIHGNSVLPPLTVVSFGKLIITHKQRLKCYSGLLEAKDRIRIFLGGKEKEPKVKRKFFLLTDDLDWRTWKLKQQWLALASSCVLLSTWPSLIYYCYSKSPKVQPSSEMESSWWAKQMRAPPVSESGLWSAMNSSTKA